MIEMLRLPLDFDPRSLLEDLDRIPDDRWIAHFNTRDYEGDWSGVALRGPAGATHPIQSLFATPGTEEWENTDLVELCPTFSQVMSSLKCPLQSVRLLRLAPGAVIKEHRDHALGLEDGEVRLHVPILTSPDVEFILSGARIEMLAGETWYLNVNLPHSVANSGSDHRVHLVADCVVNDWIRELVESAAREE